MTDDDKVLDEEAAHMAENILKGSAYSSGLTDLVVMFAGGFWLTTSRG